MYNGCMGNEPNWHKQAALSGWAVAALTFITLIVMLWLGLRDPPTQQVSSTTPSDASPWNLLMGLHGWAIVRSSILVGGIVWAASLHLKAARLEKPDRT